MRRPRLCMVVHGPYPVGEPRVAREAQAALAAGFDVDVIAASNPGEPREETVDGARVTRLPIRHVRGASALATVVEYLGFTTLATALLAQRTVVRRYDVVQVHNPPDFLFAAALLPKLLGSRTIFDVHDFAPEMFAMRFGSRSYGRHIESLMWRVERIAARLADSVVTVHEPYRRALVGRGVDPAKLTVVMNSFDESVRAASPPPASRETRRIVSHGTVTEHYGLDLLVDAAAPLLASNDDLRVEIYGSGDAVPELRDRISELGAADRIHANGEYLAHRDVIAAVEGAAAGVVCNRPIERNELAIPTKLFEFVALGIPVVAADLPGICEHFDATEVAFFRAGDADHLREVLADLLADPERARERAVRARERYRRYAWDANAETYVELLESLVRNAPPASAAAPASPRP